MPFVSVVKSASKFVVEMKCNHDRSISEQYESNAASGSKSDGPSCITVSNCVGTMPFAKRSFMTVNFLNENVTPLYGPRMISIPRIESPLSTGIKRGIISFRILLSLLTIKLQFLVCNWRPY